MWRRSSRRSGCFNPLCVGAGLQTKPPTAGLDDCRDVSIPSVSGRVFRQGEGEGREAEGEGFQSPLCRGGSSDTPRIMRGWTIFGFQSPLCRGGSSDPRSRRSTSWTPKFQSPLCRGGSSDVLGSLKAERKGKFQSPLCRGGSSDEIRFSPGGRKAKFQSPLCRGGSSDLSGGPRRIAPACFNPLCVGAGLQTASVRSGANKPQRFQSPLCRGGSSDMMAAILANQNEIVSIPSVSGRVFRRTLPPWQTCAHVVSIPSVSGRVFRPAGKGNRGLAGC